VEDILVDHEKQISDNTREMSPPGDIGARYFFDWEHKNLQARLIVEEQKLYDTPIWTASGSPHKNSYWTNDKVLHDFETTAECSYTQGGDGQAPSRSSGSIVITTTAEFDTGTKTANITTAGDEIKIG
jgi:hypothetical protein